ncbi:MAG: Asp-tRNA(Asn)/Glu-tRNA(Gln) amidotransferase subunit GatC [Proteobacteria bacterium]|nr:Asp-tRNA(Asn)/Glu-tRNA(Gln) amidotransferase subunit GatC [Pseudomonadota bacterium]
MSLNKSEVQKIAWLAGLAIDEQDIPNYSDELSNILDLVERMNSANTEGISPISHPLDLSARLRADKVTENNQRDHFQENAPLTDDGCYLVPKVIE